jgi:kynurenine 3-monooxygenase
MSSSENKYSVTVVGGGLVGSLIAVTLAQRGWQVDLYELRQDMRGTPPASNRSINLALSERGIHALKRAGAYDLIEPTLIPMKGRMLHLSGKTEPTAQAYGANGQTINSVERSFVNDTLLDMADALPNVNIHFSHTLVSCDLGTTSFM